jgi:hypothetical protein
MRRFTRSFCPPLGGLLETLFLSLAIWLVTAIGHGQMLIQGIQDGTAPASNYDRFDNNPDWIGNPVNWPAGAPPVTSAIPWAGVGRDITSGRWATLISPDYVISANHYSPAVGDTVQFFYTNNPNGPSETRTIAASEWLQTSVPGDQGDVWIGRLSSPIIHINPFPILKLPNGSDYSGLGIDTFGLSAPIPGNATSVRLGRNVIEPYSANYLPLSPPLTGVNNAYVYQYDYGNPGVGPDTSQIVAGDSGAPSFFLYAGATPALTGLHWYNNSPVDTLSGDTWLSNYATDIQTGINQLSAAAGLTPDTVKTVSPVRGDFNLDGRLSAADIAGMFDCLSNVSLYESTHGMNDAYLDYIGDLNGDGKVNNADLQSLLFHLLSGKSFSPVPEPSAWELLVLGGLALTVFMARRGNISGILGR